MYECSIFYVTAQLLDVFLFWSRAACDSWLASCGPKHTLSSLSNTLFLLVSSTTEKLQPSTVEQACSKLINSDKAVVYAWMCQELDVAKHTMFAFLFCSYLHNRVSRSHFHMKMSFYYVNFKCNCKLWSCEICQAHSRQSSILRWRIRYSVCGCGCV